MGAPVFTAAELRRALKVAAEFSATVEVNPRQGVIRFLASEQVATQPVENQSKEDNLCDEAFGL